jgi:hypothetical protein
MAVLAIAPRARDLTGLIHGALTAIAPTAERSGEYAIWECRCQCGRTIFVSSRNLKSGRGALSCGCVEMPRASGSGREYRIWTDMRTRCHNPRNKRYPRYGGRGIRVCDRWNSFALFLKDMGPCPAGMSLERDDNDGDYCPTNCRWATYADQANNSSHVRLLSFGGRTMSLHHWAIELGINEQTLQSRLNFLGWTVERTLSTPAANRGR